MNTAKFTVLSENLVNTSGKYMLEFMPFSGYKSFKINRALIPQSFDCISAARGNNKFRVESTTITIPDGTYNIIELTAYLKSQLILVDASFNVTYYAVNHTVTISRTTAFTIDKTISTLMPAIGFNSSQTLTGVNTYTGLYAYNPLQLGSIALCIGNMNYFAESKCSKSYENFITQIPVKTVYDDYIDFEPTYPQIFNFQNGDTVITKTEICFRFREGIIIDFKNVPFLLEIELTNKFK